MTLVYAGLRINSIPELADMRELFGLKFGENFIRRCENNIGLKVVSINFRWGYF